MLQYIPLLHVKKLCIGWPDPETVLIPRTPNSRQRRSCFAQMKMDYRSILFLAARWRWLRERFQMLIDPRHPVLRCRWIARKYRLVADHRAVHCTQPDQAAKRGRRVGADTGGMRLAPADDLLACGNRFPQAHPPSALIADRYTAGQPLVQRLHQR